MEPVKQKNRSFTKKSGTTSITKRWVRGSLLITLAVLLVAWGLILYYIITGYYNNASSAMQDQINALQTQLSLFSSTSSEEKHLRLIRTVEQFEEKEAFELMLVNSSGHVVLTSSSLLPTSREITPDVYEALRAGSGGIGSYTGENENGEKIMAFTRLTPYSSGGIVAMRLVTSLTRVDAAIYSFVLASFILLVLVLLASLFSGLYFIRSIVIPLRKAEITATRIAEGDFATRIDYHVKDEMGSLCNTINHMAEELGNTERMKNDFIASVSHELRTPLTSIKGWTETVGQLQNPQDATLQRGLSIISGETDRLYNMVEELLDFSKMQNGLQLQPTLIDLGAEAEETALLTMQRVQSLGLHFETDIPEYPVPVFADAHRVRQALLNVLDNAIKYSSTGDCIQLRLTQDAQSATLIVQDEGRGILAEDLENVTVKFYKGKGALRGSGIGLAVVDEIINAHGGTLSLQSEKGTGTIVSLRFPLSHTKRFGDPLPKSPQTN